MSWTGLPASQITDWSQVDFLNQFVDAINERHNFINGSDPLLQFSVGDDVQSAGAIKNFQDELEDIAPAYYDVSGSPPFPMYTLSSWRGAAGLEGGFTRKYPRTISSTSDPGSNGDRAFWGSQDSGSTGSSHGATKTIYEHDGSQWAESADQLSDVNTISDSGKIERGDYIGPWLWNELQDGIKALEGVITNDIGHANGEFGNEIGDINMGSGTSEDRTNDQGEEIEASISEAKQRAEDDFDANDTGIPWYNGVAEVERGYDHNNNETTRYTARMQRGQVWIRASSSGDLVNADIALWCKATGLEINPSDGDTREFDDHGYGFVEDQWTKIEEELDAAPDANGDWEFIYGPADPMPLATWPSSDPNIPPDPVTSCVIRRGYELKLHEGSVKPRFTYA